VSPASQAFQIALSRAILFGTNTENMASVLVLVLDLSLQEIPSVLLFCHSHLSLWQMNSLVVVGCGRDARLVYSSVGGQSGGLGLISGGNTAPGSSDTLYHNLDSCVIDACRANALDPSLSGTAVAQGIALGLSCSLYN
jgi:hypothetical protein